LVIVDDDLSEAFLCGVLTAVQITREAHPNWAAERRHSASPGRKPGVYRCFDASAPLGAADRPGLSPLRGFDSKRHLPGLAPGASRMPPLRGSIRMRLRRYVTFRCPYLHLQRNWDSSAFAKERTGWLFQATTY